MSFWNLLIRIAILVLTFIAGWGVKDKVDYHTKPLRAMVPSQDGKPHRLFPLFHKNESTGQEEPLTEAEYDRLLWQGKTVEAPKQTPTPAPPVATPTPSPTRRPHFWHPAGDPEEAVQ